MQTGQELESKERFAQTVRQSIREEVFKAKSPTQKGHRFLIWAITKLFDASPDEIENQITDGPNDEEITMELCEKCHTGLNHYQEEAIPKLKKFLSENS